MESNQYDLVVVGGGPGGYTAAERAGELGKRVLLVERDHLGGVCANYGCIPTKSLLNSSKKFIEGERGARFGAIFENRRFDYATASEWRDKTVATLRGGVAELLKARGVEVVPGEAVLVPAENGGFHRVSLPDGDYLGQNVVIATGSEPIVPDIPGVDLPKVVTSREMLQLESLPERIVVVGAGIIGMEFASFLSNVGVGVDVVELSGEICPMLDSDVSKGLRREMKGINFHLNHSVVSIDDAGVSVESAKGVRSVIPAELVLLAVGRRPATHSLANLGIEIDATGVRVDDRMRTNIPGIYAVGDVVGRSPLAHSAIRMGEVAVAQMFGDGSSRMRYGAIPWAIYTLPEAAGCGLTEEQAKERGYNPRTGTSQMRANGRFLAEHGREAGFCKIVTDSEGERILGIHILGGVASELVGLAALILEMELRVKELKELVLPHPTLSETLRDACWRIR